MILRNKRRQMQVIQLSHEEWCVGLGHGPTPNPKVKSKKAKGPFCECQAVIARTIEEIEAAGIRKSVAKNHPKVIGPVLTLLPLERKKDVPESVKKNPTIVRWLATNILQALADPLKGSTPVRGDKKARKSAGEE